MRLNSNSTMETGNKANYVWLLGVITLIAALFLPLRRPPMPETKWPSDRLAQEIAIQEAMFRDLLKSGRAEPSVRVAFMSLKRGEWRDSYHDPPMQLIRRLADSNLPVKPVSQSIRDGRSAFFRERGTGRKGILLYVEHISWQTHKRVLVRAGYYLGEHASLGASFRVERDEGAWKVRGTEGPVKVS